MLSALNTKLITIAIVITLGFAAACTRYSLISQAPETAQTEQPAPPAAEPSPEPTPRPPLPETIDRELEAELTEAAKAAKGTVGVGAVMLETGQAVYLERDGRFPMQSVYKLPIAMTVLKMMDDGKVRLDQNISISPDDFVRQGFHSPIRNANPSGTILPLGEVLRASLSESDGTANDVLLDLAGGPATVMRYLEGLGVRDVIVANSEKEISRDWETQFRNWATPAGAVELLRAVHERRGMDEQTATLLNGIMTETETGDRRIKATPPEGATLAHKTGTGNTENGITGATNDIGIITTPDGRHIAIAIFVMNSSADGPTREKVIADIARAVYEKWIGGEKQKDANTSRPL